MIETLKIEPEVIDDIYFQLNVKRPTKTSQKILEENLIKKAYLMGCYEYKYKTKMTNQTNCNHRTPHKPEVQYYDEQMVIVNGVSYTRTEPTPIVIREDESTIFVGGVKYQKVEEQKPRTLLEIIRDWNDDDDNPPCEILVNMIEGKWLPTERFEDGEEYYIGWNDCLRHLKEKLK